MDGLESGCAIARTEAARQVPEANTLQQLRNLLLPEPETLMFP